ncbi:hypothetical protein [Allosphingosinicella humi]
MLNFINIRHAAAAAVAALILSTACISAAVGPAHALEAPRISRLA